MKKHTTNYINTFIEVSEDCPVNHAQIPPEKKEKTLAGLQYEKIIKNPYRYSSDDIIFECYAIKNDISENEKDEERQKFFSKGQACLRSSPLAKRYGFGFHHNSEGKVALIPIESTEYRKLLTDSSVVKTKAMRSKRK
ncbi:hypothetical protein EGY07_10550 [Chryseobacterium indologenes]|uniref:Uncharacterized protein n=1 Tax=Chryseobacterium indologenes TaxID=253 RepID=A0AAD1DUA4_CHRID|nr:DUF6157 family protein [Chryseobacterium indologenes]ATN05037.1 hypothetical protein CRN76_06295 [Chryseobacterium indologenes]AYY86210.1 hypothetical protein EGX91_17455 [Chryseobacterium indologenes]AYZ35982.1 hypothetical protein EGY07_10550 [Chryseobacterium indologenes]AZB16618.1 hypothetical protein EG352_01930 [Chryseobacterium indologenes]MBF6644767.1 hypothetical protein [Chryseobacterium indologenes]